MFSSSGRPSSNCIISVVLLLLFSFKYVDAQGGGAPAIPTPIKAVWLTSTDIDWNNVTGLVVEAAAQGYNMIYMSFIDQNLNPLDYAGAWAGAAPAVQKQVADQVHGMGALLIVTVRLAQSSGVNPYTKNATALALGVCDWAKRNYLDGVDWYPTNIQSGFISAPGQSAQYTIDWLTNVTLVTRQQIGNSAIMTHSPAAVYFGAVGDTSPYAYVGTTGGYNSVYAVVGTLIDLINVYYFNNNPGCDETCNQIFVQSLPTGSTSCKTKTSVMEINTYGNISLSKLVVVKPAQSDQALSGGYVSPQLLHTCIVMAEKSFGWNTGVGLFRYSNETDMANWLAQVFLPEIPDAPLAPSMVDRTGNTISLTWQYPAYDGYSTISFYTVLRNQVVVYVGPLLSYTDTSLQKGTTYTYALYATNVAGNSSLSTATTITTLDSPGEPLAPIQLSVSATAISISWVAPSYTGYTDITKYDLRRNDTTIYQGMNFAYNDTGLQPRTTYTYSVIAWNIVGSSVSSDETAIITGVTVPGAPNKVVVLDFTTSWILVGWTAPAFDGGMAITQYQLMNGEDMVYSGPNTSYQDSGLSPGKPYQYTVCAINSVGTSRFSPVATLSTQDASSDDGGTSSKGPNVALIGAIVAVVIIAVIIIGVIVVRRRKNRREVNTKGIDPSPSTGIMGRSMSVAAMLKDSVNLPLSEFNSSNLITPYEELTIVRKLGSGGSGYVYVGEWRNTAVAIKEYRDQNIETTDFIRESEIHAKLRHPNVVQLLAICLPPHLCAVSEYMTRGSLTDVLEKQPPELTWMLKCQMLLDITKGMDYLVKSRIIHRDLKSQNCLVDRNWCCKIADFGTSKFLEKDATATVYVPRTAQWTAPEVITKNEYSEKSDVYSFGIIMWEVLTGKLPYEGMFAFHVEDRTVKGQRLTIPLGAETWFQAVMQACWHAEAAERPTFDSLVKTFQYAVENPATASTPSSSIRGSAEHPAKYAVYRTDTLVNREQSISYVGENGMDYATL